MRLTLCCCAGAAAAGNAPLCDVVQVLKTNHLTRRLPCRRRLLSLQDLRANVRSITANIGHMPLEPGLLATKHHQRHLMAQRSSYMFHAPTLH
jgi:hypothetical protein